MKHRYAKPLAWLVVAAWMLTLAQPAPAAKYEWNAALNVVEDTMPYIVMEEFKRLLEERSHGDISLTIYPAGQLGGDREMSEGVMTGNIEFSATNPPTMVSLVPKAAIFDIHNVFTDVEHARRTLDGPLFAKIREIFNEKNAYTLGFADLGPRHLMSNKKVESMADLAGQKIRVQENKHQIAYWKSLNANPTPMDWGEVYIGLQQGTIDANEQPYDFIVSAKLYEVQKYLMDTGHQMQFVILFMNRQLQESLPDDVKALVEQAGRDACLYGRKQNDIRMGEKKAFLEKQMEFVTLSPEFKKEMVERSMPARDSVREAVGDELYNFFMDCVEKAK